MKTSFIFLLLSISFYLKANERPSSVETNTNQLSNEAACKHSFESLSTSELLDCLKLLPFDEKPLSAVIVSSEISQCKLQLNQQKYKEVPRQVCLENPNRIRLAEQSQFFSQLTAFPVEMYGSKGMCVLARREDFSPLVQLDQYKKCEDQTLQKNGGRWEWSYSSPRIRPYSYRNLLKDPNSPLRLELGLECTELVNKVIAEGGDFSSSILKSRVYPLSKIDFPSGAKDNLFFHWTKQEGLNNLFQLKQLSKEKATARAFREGLFDELFAFLRKRPGAGPTGYGFLHRLFYLAEDKDSSSSYGHILVLFELRNDARTISYEPEIWRRALVEVIERHHLSPACPTDLNLIADLGFNLLHYSNLFYLIAEESGIEVVDYNQKKFWYQILSPTAFISVSSGSAHSR